MEEPVFIKCEPGTAEMSNIDPELPTEEQVEVKTEPEDVYGNPFTEEELQIQDVKVEPYDEENAVSGDSLNENQLLPGCSEVPKTTLSSNHKEDKSQCNVCEKWFTTSLKLKRHSVAHSVEKPYKCYTCGKAYKSSSALGRHQLHSGEKNYFCLKCGGRFRLYSDLKRHLYFHLIGTIYWCSECDMEFTSRKNLDSHVVSHTHKESPVRIILR